VDSENVVIIPSISQPNELFHLTSGDDKTTIIKSERVDYNEHAQTEITIVKSEFIENNDGSTSVMDPLLDHSNIDYHEPVDEEKMIVKINPFDYKALTHERVSIKHERQIVNNYQLAAPIDNESYNKTYDTNNLDEEFNKRKKCRLVLRKMKIVNGTPGFCPVCEEHNRNIKLHLRRSHEICTREKLFCDHCSKVFFTKTELLVHLKQAGVEAARRKKKKRRRETKKQPKPKAVMPNQRERLIFCSICDGFLANKFAYKVHLAKVHNTDEAEANQIVCDICGLYFESRYRLKIHQEKTHDEYKVTEVPQTYECLTCSLKFMSKDKVISHVEVAHNGSKTKVRKRPMETKEMSSKVS